MEVIMKTRPLNIAVSGLNATDNPGPGVPVIRSIRESGQFSGTITGLSYDPMDPGIYMDGTCEDVYLMAYPSQGAGRLLERIREINEKKTIDVIIPTLDAELSAYLKIRGELEAMGIHTFLPDAAALGMTSKANLAKLSGMGIDVPGGKELYDPGALWQAGETFRFPLVVKGRFYEAHVAYSAAEAEFYFHKISARWGLPVIVQEFVRGEEYDTVALGDGEGGLIGAVPMKKMQLTDKGKAWGGITIEDTRMNRFVRDVIWKLKWRGPCELEMIKEKKTGRFYMIELNPRFPAWCYLSVGAGQNLPWATVKLALSVPVTPFDAYSVGTMFLRNSVDHIYPLSDYRKMTTVNELHRRWKTDEKHIEKVA